MTTLQPRLVRADTLDLQAHNGLSAQDHSRSPTFQSYTPRAQGSHLRETLRTAEESAYHDRRSSPRMSGDGIAIGPTNHTNQYDSTDEDVEDEHQDDPNSASQHDGDYDDGNDENDEDLEDDLLDKISSSPSIEDGKYTSPLRPLRVDSLGFGAYPASSSLPTRGTSPNSLRTLSLASRSQTESWNLYAAHHPCGRHVEYGHGSFGAQSHSICQSDDLSHLLFPDDPLLDDCLDNGSDGDDQEWDDEGEPWYQEDASSDDVQEDFQFSTDPRFIDSGWGGECLRETEDIDFEFVYALHTFVATVEGQANATKGDTMVLLDDSNSYWWLVRVVKDGSIGYLPAEHIETPTERLARLNKHRNIDLSASMLGDNPEKSKNPLKKAMRRRNAKTVAFTAPTYYEPSEYDYDSEDDDEEDGMDGGVSEPQGLSTHDPQTDDQEDQHQSTDLQDSVVIVNGTKLTSEGDQTILETPTSTTGAEVSEPLSNPTQLEDKISRSRNGTVRNTDSFFKDDTAETKKISLTPRLLQLNSDSSTSAEQGLRAKASTDTFDKILSPDDKSKEKEKKKEKKGMLSGLFKRKDKGAKNAKIDAEDDKSDEVNRAPQSVESVESPTSPQSPERKPGKLQKQYAPAGLAIRTSPTDPRQQAQPYPQPQQYGAQTTKLPTHSPNNSVSVSKPSDASELSKEASKVVNTGPQVEQTSQQSLPQFEKRSIFAPITGVLRSTSTSSQGHDNVVKPLNSKRATERFAIDESELEDAPGPTVSEISQIKGDVSPLRTSQVSDGRPDSAAEVSPVEASDEETDERDLQPRPLATHHSAEQFATAHNIHGTAQSDTASTSKPSPSLATHTPSTSRSTPTWSDASLRSYMDSDQDIRDLIIIVHDKSNVTPVGPDHPLMGGLFTTERTRLTEMQSQLDSMLTTWMSKKNPGLLAR